MSERPPGELEIRASEVVDVHFPERLIDLIVMPYESEALVPFQGRMVREVVSRGAFDGIQRRANRIRVNRDHDLKRTVGKARTLYPGREEGLVAQVEIADTPLGEETLALARAGCLDASAGFLPMPDGERWEGRSLRRLVKCWLGHIALTPEPAYEGAEVLAVRAAEQAERHSATPNLDRYRELVLEERLARVVASDPALQDR